MSDATATDTSSSSVDWGGVASGIGSLAGAVGDLYGAQGSAASASAYSQASDIAKQNEQLAKEATQIQLAQQTRQIYQVIGKQQAEVAGAGLSASGSALDILRSSQSQGALTKAITTAQGAIEANAYAEQAGMYQGMANAAGSTSSGQSSSGDLQMLGSLATIAVAVWVVCTELKRQGKLPPRWYPAGARRFIGYPESVKRGYYWWAIPTVKHMRKYPEGLVTRSMAWVFRNRAEYIAAQAGVAGARRTLTGAFMLAAAFSVCWLLGNTVVRETKDWRSLYGTDC